MLVATRAVPAVAEGPIESLVHPGGVDAVIQLSANDAATVEVDRDSKLPAASRGADVGDGTGPAAAWIPGLKLLLDKVFHHPTSSGAGPLEQNLNALQVQALSWARRIHE